jgi:hypothetical protein
MTGTTCTASDAALPDLGSGIQGVTFWMNSTPSTTLPQAGDVILQISEFGALTGGLSQGQSLPVGWDFTITTDASSVHWFLEIGIGNSSLNNLGVFDANGTSLSSSGKGAITMLADASGSVYLDATLDIQYTGGTTMSVSVPGAGSFDFLSATGAAGVPEPASVILAGFGLLLISSWRIARR